MNKISLIFQNFLPGFSRCLLKSIFTIVFPTPVANETYFLVIICDAVSIETFYYMDLITQLFVIQLGTFGRNVDLPDNLSTFTLNTQYIFSRLMQEANSPLPPEPAIIWKRARANTRSRFLRIFSQTQLQKQLILKKVICDGFLNSNLNLKNFLKRLQKWDNLVAYFC